MKMWMPVLIVLGIIAGWLLAWVLQTDPVGKTGIPTDSIHPSPAGLIDVEDPEAAVSSQAAPVVPQRIASDPVQAEGVEGDSEKAELTNGHGGAKDPVTGASRFAFPRQWPTQGSMRWEVASYHAGSPRQHTLDATWEIDGQRRLQLADPRLDGVTVAEVLVLGRKRGILQVVDPAIADPILERLARDAGRHVLALATELPTRMQEVGSEFALAGTRYRLDNVAAEQASLVDCDNDQPAITIDSLPDGRRRVTRIIRGTADELRLEQRLTALFNLPGANQHKLADDD